MKQSSRLVDLDPLPDKPPGLMPQFFAFLHALEGHKKKRTLRIHGLLRKNIYYPMLAISGLKAMQDSRQTSVQGGLSGSNFLRTSLFGLFSPVSRHAIMILPSFRSKLFEAAAVKLFAIHLPFSRKLKTELSKNQN